MRRALLSLVVATAVSLAVPMAASAQVWRPLGPTDALARPEPVSPGPIAFPSASAPHIIVGVVPGADLDGVADALRPYASSLQILRPVGEVALVASNASAVAELAAHDPRIDFAEPDGAMHTLADPADGVDAATGIAFDWQYDAVGAGPAIAAVGGGSSTVVAVVDTGVDVANPDLAGRILPGYDATGTDGTVFDNVGHGTFVAGLISMVDGNGIGGKGVAGNTQVLPVRASADGNFADSAIITAITWAATNGAGVVNLSLGGPGDDPAVDRAIDYAVSKNVLVVASSGNSGDTTDNPVDYPAAYVGGPTGSGAWSVGLSVGATMPNGQIAGFSTHNAYVSVAAPGAGPNECFGDFSTIPVSTTNTEWDTAADPCSPIFSQTPGTPTDGRWAYGEGTSFSAPIVSGIAALVRQANAALTPAQVADVIRRSAVQTMGTGWNEFTGAGVVNATNAVALARTYDTTPPTLTFSAVPTLAGVQTSVSAVDGAGAGTTPAGGVTIGLEESSDGVNYVPIVLPTAAPIDQLVTATAHVWLRSTACDANHNCAVHVAGPLAARVPTPKVKPTVHLKLVSHTAGRLKVSVALAAGGKGRAVVEVESFNGKTWHAFDRLSVAFGKSRTRTERVSQKGRYRIRAHVVAGPGLLSAFSGSLNLRVR